MQCRRCGGKGQIISTPCKTCKGQGLQREQKTITITVPPGTDIGTRMRVPGYGMAGPDGAKPGNLYVVVEVEPDPLFKVLY